MYEEEPTFKCCCGKIEPLSEARRLSPHPDGTPYCYSCYSILKNIKEQREEGFKQCKDKIIKLLIHQINNAHKKSDDYDADLDDIMGMDQYAQDTIIIRLTEIKKYIEKNINFEF